MASNLCSPVDLLAVVFLWVILGTSSLGVSITLNKLGKEVMAKYMRWGSALCFVLALFDAIRLVALIGLGALVGWRS